MKWKSVSRMSMLAIPIMVVCGLLVAASSKGPTARAEGQDTIVCTDKTLQGDYGSQIEGTILGPNLPFRGLAMARFDGKGNITQVDHIVLNGIPPKIEWTPGTGTYPVNPHFVVVNNGKQINQVVDANAATAVGYRVE